MSAAPKLDLTEYERLNITKLAFRYELDKATIKKRLQANGIEPVEIKAKETVYELTPRLEAILGKVDDRLQEAKLRSQTAEAELREAKVLQMRGDLVAAAEMRDLIQRLFSAMYKECTIRQPRRLLHRLRKAKTQPEAEKIWKADTQRMFQALRDDHEGILAQD